MADSNFRGVLTMPYDRRGMVGLTPMDDPRLTPYRLRDQGPIPPESIPGGQGIVKGAEMANSPTGETMPQSSTSADTTAASTDVSNSSKSPTFIGDQTWEEVADERTDYSLGNSLGNPYANLHPSEGGGRHPFEYMLMEGLDPGDPQTYATIRDDMNSYRGPTNPTGPASPYDPQYYVRPDDRIQSYMFNAPKPMQEQYMQSRFIYDNGLNAPYGNAPVSQPTGSGQNPAWDEVLPGGGAS
jgi:hypothetical protein